MPNEHEASVTDLSRFLPEGLHCPHFASPTRERMTLVESLPTAGQEGRYVCPFFEHQRHAHEGRHLRQWCIPLSTA